MKIVIDNNVVLDALLERKPFNDSAEKIFMLCAKERNCYLSANSLTDIFFVLRKSIDVKTSKTAIKHLIKLFDTIDVTKEDCSNALDLSMDDFEDALVATCASKVGADYIITRDVAFIKSNSPVKVISPDDFLSENKSAMEYNQ